MIYCGCIDVQSTKESLGKLQLETQLPAGNCPVIIN